MSSPNKSEIRQAVIDAVLTIAPEADFARLKPERSIRDQLDLDSLDFLNVLTALHQTLAVDIPEADYGQLSSLNAMVEYLARKKGVQ